MRILITGGAGYVGSHVVRSLAEAGHTPVVFDNLSTGHAASLGPAELVIGDTADGNRLGSTLHGRAFDGCIHLAAKSLVGESSRVPSEYFRNNVNGSITLFDALVKAGVPWVVFSSSAAVYGVPNQTPIGEDHCLCPTNPYGESKKVIEQLLPWYERSYGLRHISLRYFNAAGAHPAGDIGEDHTPETHLVPLALQAASGAGQRLSVYGTDYATSDGTAVRDYVHVCDLARAHVLAVERLAKRGESSAYNLGSENGFSVLDVVKAVQMITGVRLEAQPAPRRSGDPPTLVASHRKASVDLGWEPEYGLEDIVSSAWSWHSRFPHGYGR